MKVGNADWEFKAFCDVFVKKVWKRKFVKQNIKTWKHENIKIWKHKNTKT